MEEIKKLYPRNEQGDLDCVRGNWEYQEWTPRQIVRMINEVIDKVNELVDVTNELMKKAGK